ncbi:CAP domain-containing protein [Halobacillus sp. ACCC02827]|uniref:CAP domain-containing protein n=1 Tax=Halobacillus sp. ACCC02827 TaxID=3052090 RepID=UPI002570AFEF|nr:CAP domain-containing protein [Halobacillus sp. ACCC02827]WJE16480.1 CAP domain-containing protein [Halobacillus sp. ACCC02827]
MKKSLVVSGALALSLLAAPATSFASTGEVHHSQIKTQNIQIDSDKLMEWISQNEAALKGNNLQQIDIQSLLNQIDWKQGEKPVEAEAKPEAPKQEQKQEEVEAPKQVEQPKQEKVEAPKQEAQPQEQPKQEAAPQQQSEQQAQPKAEQQNEQASSEVSAFEKQVVELTNQEREKQGLAPLELDTELSAVAKDKSLDMQKNNYFSHNSPTYGSPFDMMKTYGIDYQTAGENIAMGQTSPEQVVQGWMNSEGHRKNIMNPNFTHIGVGHAEDGNYWTQMFIGK